MGLIIFAVEIVFSAVLVLAMNSRYKSNVDTSNRLYYDCCDPGMDSERKEDCKMAAGAASHILPDNKGNEEIYTWSSCKVGEEPWRKYE